MRKKTLNSKLKIYPVSHPFGTEGLGKYILIIDQNLPKIKTYNSSPKFIVQLTGAVEYTDCISAEK